jgi:xylulose-5-phosphate/fructose-6-phosphate phosphoketolase
VRGYKEEGTTTTPFDMVVVNDLDRFHLAQDVIDRVPKLGKIGAYAKQEIRNKLIEHKHYITTYGKDMPEVENWQWGYYSSGTSKQGGVTSVDSGNDPSQQGEEGTSSSRS